MNKYESVCILTPDCLNEQISNMIVKIQNKISEFSDKQINIENLGKKRLAYEVNNKTEGIYLITNFEAKPEDICKLDKFYKVTEEIMKYIIVRED